MLLGSLNAVVTAVYEVSICAYSKMCCRGSLNVAVSSRVVPSLATSLHSTDIRNTLSG